MHELGLAAQIYKQSREMIQARGGGVLERVRVRVGEFAAVEPELLKYAWEAVVAGGPDAGGLLEIDWRPARQVCASCGPVGERPPGTWLRICPRCGHPLRVEGGDELDLLEISFAAPGDAAPGDPSPGAATAGG